METMVGVGGAAGSGTGALSGVVLLLTTRPARRSASSWVFRSRSAARLAAAGAFDASYPLNFTTGVCSCSKGAGHVLPQAPQNHRAGNGTPSSDITGGSRPSGPG